MAGDKGPYYELDLPRLAQALRRRLWVLAAAALALGLAALGAAAVLAPPTYRAEALIYVSNRSPAPEHSAINNAELSAAQSLVDTYIVLLYARSTLEAVIEEGALPYTCEELAGMIESEPVNDTEIFNIAVTSRDPREAEQVANSLAGRLPGIIDQVVEGSAAKIVEYAVQPGKRVGHSCLLWGLLGALAGLTGAALLVLLRALLDPRIHHGDELARSYGLPLLGELPDVAREPDGGEGFRRLRTNLLFLLEGQPGCRRIGLVCARRGEGGSTVARGLAQALASTQRQVLLVEADLRRPSRWQQPGLSELLQGQCGPAQALAHSAHWQSLWVLPAGSPPTAPAELLAAPAMGGLLQRLGGQFQYVLVDLPAILAVSDGLPLARQLDGVVAVVRRGHCDRDDLADAMTQLAFLQVPVLGFVTTGFEPEPPGPAALFHRGKRPAARVPAPARGARGRRPQHEKKRKPDLHGDHTA